jgi:hypothetical protein
MNALNDLLGKSAVKTGGNGSAPAVSSAEPVDTSKTGPTSAPTTVLGGDQSAGRRRRGRRQNSWLSHVKQTMKMHKGKSFKQILQLAKKSYHNRQSQSHSQSQSNQNGGKRRRQKSRKTRQNGGSGAKQGFSVADNAAAY